MQRLNFLFIFFMKNQLPSNNGSIYLQPFCKTFIISMALDKSSSLKLFSSTIVFIFWHSFFSASFSESVFSSKKYSIGHSNNFFIFIKCNKVTPTLPFSILLKCVCDIHSFLASTFCDILFSMRKSFILCPIF